MGDWGRSPSTAIVIALQTDLSLIQGKSRLSSELYACRDEVVKGIFLGIDLETGKD